MISEEAKRDMLEQALLGLASLVSKTFGTDKSEGEVITCS